MRYALTFGTCQGIQILHGLMFQRPEMAVRLHYVIRWRSAVLQILISAGRWSCRPPLAKPCHRCDGNSCDGAFSGCISNIFAHLITPKIMIISVSLPALKH